MKIPKALSKGEEALAKQLTAEGIWFAREVKFHPTRRWRLDFVLLKDNGVGYLFNTFYAVEIEGGIWSGGAHTRGKHFEGDCIKYAEAAVAGYRVMRFSTGQIMDGTALSFIKRALE